MQLPDLHIHTTMSDGEVDLKKVVTLAKRNDIVVGICDHISIYHQVYDDYAFREYIAELRRYGPSHFHRRIGCGFAHFELGGGSRAW